MLTVFIFLFEQVVTVLLPGLSSQIGSLPVIKGLRAVNSSEKVVLCDSHVKTAARFSSARFC